MKIDNAEEKAFLYELYTQTRGNTEAQVSMYDIGNMLGLEKSAAGTLAENLFIQGFAELKTLSGGIGITTQGMRALDINPPAKLGEEPVTLGKSLVLEDTGKDAAIKIINEIKTVIPDSGLSFETMEELILDLKTIEVQMLSPRPKTQIIREILRSIKTCIEQTNSDQLVQKLEMLITS